MKIRTTDNPNALVEVTDAEYYRLVAQGRVIAPYDPDRTAPPWPDLSGTYVQAPDVGRGGRHSYVITEEDT